MNLNKKEFLIGTLLGEALLYRYIGRTGLNKAFISFELKKENT
jgi:hypothetical protein